MPAPFSFVPAAVDDSGTMDYSQFIRPRVVPWGSWGQQAMDWLRGANARAQASTRSPELQASTADAFRGAAALSGSGYHDIGQGDIIGGVPKVLMGSVAGFLSPVTGATETLVEKPLTQLTGNPDFGQKAGFLAGIPELTMPEKLAMASPAAMAVAGKYAPWVEGSERALASGAPESNLRGAVRDLLYSQEAHDAQKEETQRHFEAQTNLPQGYAWIDGRLTHVGPDKRGNMPPGGAPQAPAPETPAAGASWLDVARGKSAPPAAKIAGEGGYQLIPVDHDPFAK